MKKCNDEFERSTRRILPISFDDSLSYYEQLCRILARLNELGVTVDDLLERIEGAITADKIKQSTGTDAGAVMSQKAVTEALADIPTQGVTSVNGKDGDVTLDGTDIKLTTNQQTIQHNINRIDNTIDSIPRVSAEATGDDWTNMTIDGVTHGFPSGGGSGEPNEYLKRASVAGSTLTLTKKDGSTVTFTAAEPDAYIKSATVSGNTLTLTTKTGSTVPFAVDAITDIDDTDEIVVNITDGVAELYLANDITNKLARALLVPIAPPAVQKVVTVNSSGEQEMEDYVEVPKATTSDNGKVLGVQNGGYALVNGGGGGGLHVHRVSFYFDDEGPLAGGIAVEVITDSATPFNFTTFSGYLINKNIPLGWLESENDSDYHLTRMTSYIMGTIQLHYVYSNESAGEGTYLEFDNTAISSSLVSDFEDNVDDF